MNQNNNQNQNSVPVSNTVSGQNSKKRAYTILGVVVLILIILLIVAMSGDDVKTDLKSNTASTTASTTVTTENTNNSGNQSSSVKTNKSNTQTVSGLSATETNALIRSSFLRVPTTGVDVTLVNGGANYVDGISKGRIEVGQIFMQIPTNDGVDVITGLTLTNTEKESSLNYVALFHISGKTAKYTSSVLIGDRLPVVSVVETPEPKYVKDLAYMDSKKDYRLTVNYLGRKNLEPVSTPASVSNDMIVRVMNHIVSR